MNRKDGKQKRAPLSNAEREQIIQARVVGRQSSVEIAKAFNTVPSVVCPIIKPFPLTAEEHRERKARVAGRMRAVLQSRGGYEGGAVWTKTEMDIIRRVWPTKPRPRVLKALPGRSWAAITRQASSLDIRRSRVADGGAKNRIDPFYKELRQVREARGITRDGLADRIGTHPVQMAKWETGATVPRWLMLRAWLDALEYDIQLIPKNAAERTRGKRTWLTEEDEMLRELIAQGCSTHELALSLKRTAREIELRCKTLGLGESEATRLVSGMTRARL